MATTSEETGRQIALVDIRVPDNVRDLDPEHVKALAGSIGLQGMLVPVVVRNDGDGFELVAGFHRVAAARSLGLTAVPVVIRDAQTEDADRAVENITRKQLNPYEEAKAVRAMLERGLTEDTQRTLICTLLMCARVTGRQSFRWVTAYCRRMQRL
jgi:ParB/RepB/Spo0J family partition protein